jgi:PAS domain-containing protein
MSLPALLLELNLLISLLGATLALLRGGSAPGRRTYAVLALSAAIWCAGELLGERGAVEPWTGVRLSLLGLVLVGPTWLGLAVRMARLSVARRMPWLAPALALPGLLIWALLFFEPWDAIVMPAPHRPGPLWWVYALYAYVLIAAGIGIHVWCGLRRQQHRWQAIGIAVTGLLPLVVHVSWTLRGFPGPFDPTPMTLTPVGLVLAASLFPGGLLDVRPIAHQDLIERLPLGVVIADRSGTIFEVNPHAELALALSRAELLGRALDAILAEVPTCYRVETSEVALATRVVARFAFLYPPEMQGARRRDAA